MTTVILDGRDATDLATVLEFFAGWLRAELDYARHRLPLHGVYSVDDLQADTARLIKVLEAT